MALAKRFGYRVTVEVPPGVIGVWKGMPDEETANRLIQEFVEDALRFGPMFHFGVLVERKSASGKLIVGKRPSRTIPQPVVVAKPVKPLRAKRNPKAIARIGKGT